MNIEASQKFIDEGIVEVEEWQTTLFDIAGFPHYENVVSNVYAYFLNPAEKHGLGTLFIDALQSLIGIEYNFESVEVQREYVISNKKRIDIVVTSKNNDEAPTKALIIENKMFHHLHNDLDEYYNYFKLDNENKQGILLTLWPLDPNNKYYKNITHREWMDQIWSLIGSYIMNLPDDTLHNLKQFSKNLSNFTMSHKAKEYFSFYTKNLKHIEEINKLKVALDNHVWLQVNNAINFLPDLKLTYQHKKNWALTYYYNDIHQNVFFTVFPFYGGYANQNITIVIELQQEGLNALEGIDQLKFTSEERSILKPRNPDQIKKGYLHYAESHFPVTEKDIENLSRYIADKINTTPLLTVYKKVHNFVYKK